jgi:hypothetical protein
MLRKTLALATAACAVLSGTGVVLSITPAMAEGEQFIPGLVYRTGPYAPNGIPFADGVSDYLSMINERDGGINGVKVIFEECETGYATDKGVECYERLKANGPTGAAYFSPLSTGITFSRRNARQDFMVERKSWTATASTRCRSSIAPRASARMWRAMARSVLPTASCGLRPGFSLMRRFYDNDL